MGKFTWDVNFPPPLGLSSAESKLQSGTVYSNTFLAGLTWEPIPRETDSNNLVDNFNNLSAPAANNNGVNGVDDAEDNSNTITY